MPVDGDRVAQTLAGLYYRLLLCYDRAITSNERGLLAQEADFKEFATI